MKAPKTRKHRYVSDFTDDMDISNAISTNDCTGLIPTMPKSNDEIDAYEDIYDFRPPYGTHHFSE